MLSLLKIYVVDSERMFLFQTSLVYCNRADIRGLGTTIIKH
jgi:hypothetical protein